MWQQLLTRKSCLVDLNEKYLIFNPSLRSVPIMVQLINTHIIIY